MKEGGKKQFDVIVIGAGSAGFSAAERARQLGASVCIVEEDAWGGECPNYACVPTKALLKSAKMFHEISKRSNDFGVRVTSPTFRFSDLMSRKNDVVDVITGHGKRLVAIADKLGIETVKGSAKFLNTHEIRVGTRVLRAKSFVIATGVVDFIPPIDGLRTYPFLTYRDVVSLKKQPARIAIIGAGPVGCEFATFFQMIGTNVTLLQIEPHILHREDPEVSAVAEKQLHELGVQVFTNTKTLSVERSGRSTRVTFQQGEKKRQSVLVDQILVAAGKRANVHDLHLEKAEVKLDDRGRLLVKDTLQTSQRHIFAAGDVAGGYLFTHTAHQEGVIAGENVMQKTVRGMRKRDFRVVPRVTFVYPEVASVGLTSNEAAKLGKKLLVGMFPVGALSRAVTEGSRVGFVKIIADQKTRKVLGGHIVADRAGEMIHEVALAMYLQATLDDLANMIHAFPTYSEAITAAAASVR